MKSTEIIQPTPITQPVAVEGTRNTIPEAATGTNNASIVEGFPDMTMISPTNGGLPPFGQDFNGLFYLSTDQKVYLQNGGYITFNQDVSDTIGGYPEGAILDYITNSGTYAKVKSLIDDNTYNFIENSEYINGEYWQMLDYEGGFANANLSNLTATGQSQYNVFCVNTGEVDDDGNPSFLTYTSETVTDEETQEETTTSTLTTQGTFSCTLANGAIYEITDTLTLDVSDYEDGTYNIFIDPVNKTISLTQNEITIGSAFPSSAVSGDYLLNTSQIPYDLQQITITSETDEEGAETTTTTVTKGLNEVYAGLLTVSGGGGSLTLLDYNRNVYALTKVQTEIEVDRLDYTSDWVEAYKTLSTSTAKNTYTIDLSSLIPQDGGTYELLLTMRVLSPSAAGDAACNVYLNGGGIINTSIQISMSQPTDSRFSVNTFNYPVKAGNNITMQIANYAAYSLTFAIYAYRKVWK